MKSYLRIIRQVEATIKAGVKRDILPRFEYTQDPAHLRDEAFEGWFDTIEAELVALLAQATSLIRGTLKGEADWTSAAFTKNIRSLMGVDLAGVIRDEDLTDYLDAAVTRNAALVKGLADDGQKALKAAVTEAYLGGYSRTKLEKTITQKLGFMKSRAELIAQDQVAKVSSEVNEIRQRQVGVQEYIWMTSRDERVRPRHRHLDGKKYKWGQPTGAETGQAPGREVRCRCIARAVIDWGDGPTKIDPLTAEQQARWAASPDGRKLR